MRKETFWPLGLFITIGGTIAFFLWLIPFSATKTDSLVSNTYYQEGITYQETINRLNRTKADNKSMGIVSTNSGIQIQVQPHRTSVIQGNLSLRRPNDTSMDKDIPLSFSSDGIHMVMIAPGVWNLTARWNEDGIEYQQRERIIVSH